MKGSSTARWNWCATGCGAEQFQPTFTIRTPRANDIGHLRAVVALLGSVIIGARQDIEAGSVEAARAGLSLAERSARWAMNEAEDAVSSDPQEAVAREVFQLTSTVERLTFFMRNANLRSFVEQEAPDIERAHAMLGDVLHKLAFKEAAE